MLVVCTGGQLGLLDGLKTTLKKLELRLYVNFHTPSQFDTADDYTEPVYPQYKRMPLDQWGNVRSTPTGHAKLLHEIVTLPAAGVTPQVLIYGVWWADKQGRLWIAEALPTGPFVLKDGHPDFTFQPQLLLRGIL